MTTQHIGQRIAQIRTSKGVTQAELREKTGINVWRLEEGRVVPKIDTIAKIADALDVSVYELFK